MTLEQINNSISELGDRIRNESDRLIQLANDDNVSMEDVTACQTSVNNLQQRMDALRASRDRMQGDQAHGVPAQPAENRSLRDLRASNEYARAFAYAIRNGIVPGRSEYTDRCKPLYDAMTIAGGDPAGEDGGFLVPEDVDNTIRELRRTLNPLAELFSNETVSTNSGWRVMDTSPTSGFTELDSEIPEDGIPSDDQPVFVKVPYTLKTYGLFIPVSRELSQDEDANLFGYLSNWFAKKQVLTENSILLTKLRTLSPATISANHITAIKNVLNVTLDPAISAAAKIVTNQTGFQTLDALVDGKGRPMLQPDVTNPSVYRFAGRDIVVLSDAQLVNITSGADTLAPMFIGDFSAYATLYTRQPLEVTSTDVGGNSFRTNSIEVRGITRLGASVFDSSSVVYRQVK